MKKKIISSLIVIVLMIIGASSCYANSVDSTRTYSGIFQYEVVSGNVNITKFINENNINNVIIPDTIQGMQVTSIKEGAFDSVDSMHSVTIPKSVKYVNQGAFVNCQNLTTVTFGSENDEPTNVMDCYISWYAFQGCNKLENLCIYQNISQFSDYNDNNKFEPTLLGLRHLKKVEGHKGSWAEKYAKKYSLSFKPIINFNDVNYTSWYYKAVKFSYEKGMIKGYNSTTFAPNDKMTRGMLVTILWRLEGCPSATGKKKFPDVDYNAYYGNAIKWAYDSGVALGYENGKFGPDDEITREDFIVILARYEGQIYDGDVFTTGTDEDLAKFLDYEEIDRYALNRMKWAVATGVITGNADGTINPRGTATRAEAAAILQKYYNKVVK